MDISTQSKTRFTSKAYIPNKNIPIEKIQQIKDILRFAPSSVNSQPWHFILASSTEAKEKIAKAAENIHPKNVSLIKDCSLAIVFCIKTDIDELYLDELLEQEKKDGRILNKEFEQMQKAARSKFTAIHKYDLKDLLHWTEKQVYINLGGALLAISTLGLNTTPMEGIETSVVDEEFNLRQKGYMASVVVTIGYSSDDDFNAKLPKSRWPEERVFTEL